MIDHITLYVSDYQKSKDFYTAALAPLGYILEVDFTEGEESYCGFADRDGRVEYWIVGGSPSRKTHIALLATSHSEIDAFYQAALAQGGTNNGQPGLRPEYGTAYYAAFVLDPDGNNIEAMLR